MDHADINDLVVAWRKGLRRVWNLPAKAHSDLLPLLSDCFPVQDEICRRTMLFLHSCINHDSTLISSVAVCGLYARNDSYIGRNILFCSRRYRCSVDDLISVCSSKHSCNSVIQNYCRAQTPECRIRLADFLLECIMLRDGVLKFSSNINMLYDDMCHIICELSTNT